MNLSFILDFNQSSKVVFLRVDFNVPIINGIISDTKRIDDVIPTILHLIKNRNKIILVSHFGRPNGQFNEKYSLKIVYDYLRTELRDIKIHFVEDILLYYNKVVENSQFGEIIFLENIRFFKEEEQNDESFKKFLAQPVDIFCNEAFSCSHRAHTSIMIADLFDKSKKFIGQLFKNEIDAIDCVLNAKQEIINNFNSSIAIVGGSKISTKIGILKKLQKKVKKIIVVGAMSNTFFHCCGINVGKSLHEDNYHDICNALLQNKDCEIILPKFVVVTDDIKNPKIISEKLISDVVNDDIIVDVGLKSIELFIEEIKNSKLVLWNGPLGIFEVKPFDRGTVVLAEAIVNLTKINSIKSVLGGGDTLSAIKDCIDLNDFTHASTAGGAFLEYMEYGENLPGVSALLS
jgi:phosphoglycerate kinase